MADMKNKPRSAPERWVVVYPAYINSKKTIEQGRRISTTLAVENPTTQEIYDILQAGGFNPIAERKMYPRDPTRDWACQGRVRIQLQNDDGTPKFPQFSTKKALFLYLADMIPKLKSRQPGYVATSAQPAAAGGGKKNKKKK